MSERDASSHAMPAAGARPAEGRGELVGLSEIFAILWRRRAVVAATTALAGLMAVLYVLTATPLFTAASTLLIDPRGRALPNEGTFVAGSIDLNIVESQIRLISSDAVLRRAVELAELMHDESYGGARPGLLGKLLAALRGPPADPAADEEARRRAAIRKLADALSVRRPERTYVVEIEISDPDAARAARIANAIARAYLADQVEARGSIARRETAWLDTYLTELQTRVQDAETRIERFKVENRIFGPSGKLVTDQQLSEVNTELSQARGRTAAARAKLDQVEALAKAGRLPETLPEALKSGLVERLRGQYAEIARVEANYRTTLGPRHPAYIEVRQQLADTRRLIGEELKRIADATRSEFQIARANEAALQKQLGTLQNDSSSTNQALVKLRELEREAEAQRTTYEKFLKEREALARANGEGPDARIIAPAVAPERPSHPKRLAILIAALAGGGMLGVALALGLEQWQRMARPLPPAPEPAGRRMTQEPGARPPQPHREALRLVPGSAGTRALAALAARLRAGRGRTIALEPQAGSDAAAAAALALAPLLAAGGHDVLLVDGAPADPALSRGASGIVAAGETRIAGPRRLIYQLDAPEGGLFLLPALTPRGAVLPKAAEDLNFRARADFPTRFDFVLITLGGPDDKGAEPLAGLADVVLAVSGSGTSLRDRPRRWRTLLPALAGRRLGTA